MQEPLSPPDPCHPTDPIGSTEMVISPDPAGAKGVLETLDMVLRRLMAYRDVRWSVVR